MQKYMFCYTDQSSERVRRFYQEEKNSLDVVFLGASEVFTGFSPALAYEEHGFTSYMYAIDANPGALYKYQLKEVMKHQQPKLYRQDDFQNLFWYLQHNCTHYDFL